MVFNWFRRQHNDSSSSQEKQEEGASAKEPQVEKAATPTTETAQDVAAPDLLAFAKAAYKNIQQKQQSEPAEISSYVAASETPPEQAGSEAINEVSTAEESEVDSVSTLSEAQQTSTLAVAEEAVDRHSPEEVKEPTTSPVSFLERAAAERQAKQERLIASAIAVPEPEILQSVESATEIPEMSFDEGFLWSAEVLAAQGRRAEDVSIEEITWLKKLRQGLEKTRRNITNQLKAIVGQGPLNQAAVSEIEGLLLQADVGVQATDYIINLLQKKLREEALPADAAIAYLKQIIQEMLDAPAKKSPLATFSPQKETLNIWLITGVNGAGKTTTIGKLAHLCQKSGYKCLIGAADTFRAAAVEQVKVWGQRSNVEVIANPGKNTDPAAVVFDAIAAAIARDTELLLVDTAGRLQNKKNLMDELSKIRRIIDKKAPNAKVESLLVLDATLGQNGLRQAEVFSEAAQLSGVVITKLDSTAKGGVALAVVQQLGLPIRFIGAGEGIEDLRPFSSYEFVEALLSG